MSNRWKVEHEADWLNGTYWIAWQPKKGWKSIAPKFHTHGEAMAYADHRARTITVTLPRAIGAIKEISKNTYISERAPTSPYGADILATNPQGTVGISITRDELEPLALTLLALARKGDSGGA